MMKKVIFLSMLLAFCMLAYGQTYRIEGTVEAKVLYAFILRRTELSRKNGWADDCGRIFLYFPIYEVVTLLHCGRQKAVNTLRELQYAGLVEIQKQGCGKPNRIFPKSYEAVPNTDFKKSGSGTPED